MQAVPQEDAQSIVAIMGAKGTGKTTFIKHLTSDSGVVIVDGLQLKTLDIETHPYADPASKTLVTVIDTSGFDDSGDGVTNSDTDMLEKIGVFLRESGGRKLDGLIYMHRISDIHVSSTSKDTKKLQELCGDDTLDNVRIVTTHWDDVVLEEGIRREAELAESDFKSLIASGARMVRLDNGKTSALSIMSEFTPKPAVVTKIIEMNSGGTLGETSTGGVMVDQIVQEERHDAVPEKSLEAGGQPEAMKEQRRAEGREEAWRMGFEEWERARRREVEEKEGERRREVEEWEREQETELVPRHARMAQLNQGKTSALSIMPELIPKTVMTSTMEEISGLKAEQERKLEEMREMEEKLRDVQLAAAHDEVVMQLNRVVTDPISRRQVQIVELDLPGNVHLKRLVSMLTHEGTRNYQEEIDSYATILQLQEQWPREARINTLQPIENLAKVYYDQERLNESTALHFLVLDARKAQLGFDHPDTLKSILDIANNYHRRARLSEAADLYLQILEGSNGQEEEEEEVFGRTINALKDLAETLREQAWLAEAADLYLHVIEAQKERLGLDHDDVLASVSSLAGICFDANFLDKAAELHLQVLETQDRIGGENFHHNLNAVVLLAEAYRRQGQPNEAAKLHSEVMKIRQKRLGNNHEDTLSTMAILADIYSSQKRLDEATDLYLQVLQCQNCTSLITENALNTMALLADTYCRQGKSNEAAKLQSMIMDFQTERLGAHHVDTLSSMTHLADTYRSQGRLLDAALLHSQVLERYRERFGDNHVDTLIAMGNLAATYHKQDRLSDAARLYSQVVRYREEELGVNHTDTLKAMMDLAEVYREQGRLTEAETLYTQILTIRKKVLGADDPETLVAMNHLAITYRSQGLFEKAARLFSKILDIRAAQPGILESLENLALTYECQGNRDKAAELYAVVMELKKKRLGTNHVDTVTAMNNLALTYENLGQLQNAGGLFSQVIELQKIGHGEHHPNTLASMRDLEHIRHDRGRSDDWGPILESPRALPINDQERVHPQEGNQKIDWRYWLLAALMAEVVIVGSWWSKHG